MGRVCRSRFCLMDSSLLREPAKCAFEVRRPAVQVLITSREDKQRGHWYSNVSERAQSSGEDAHSIRNRAKESKCRLRRLGYGDPKRED